MKAPWPVANRDFLQWRLTEEDSDGNNTPIMCSTPKKFLSVEGVILLIL